MRTSPTPWTALADGTVLDSLANPIGQFKDHRDAFALCEQLTDTIRDLNEQILNLDSEWENADAAVLHLDGIIEKIDKVLKDPILDAVRVDLISQIVSKYQDGTNYSPIEKRG